MQFSCTYYMQDAGAKINKFADSLHAFSPMYGLYTGAIGFYWNDTVSLTGADCPGSSRFVRSSLELNPVGSGSNAQNFCLWQPKMIPQMVDVWMYSYYFPYTLGWGFRFDASIVTQL